MNVIKDLNIKDLPDFYPLLGEIECGDLFDCDNTDHLDWLKRKMSLYIQMNAKYWGIYLKETPIAIVALLVDQGPKGIPYFGKKAEILEIGVYKEFRRSGHASLLLRHAEHYAKEKGVYCLYMSTYAKDSGVIHFYGKNGFVPVATLPDVHGPKEEGLVIMRKCLA